jgi:5-methylthioadenosine/S-adenosylhomocysteine deaminase
VATLIANAQLPDRGGFRRASLLVRDGIIAGIETHAEEFAHLAADRVDASRCWLLPGLVDAHAHAGTTILRGSRAAQPPTARALQASIMLGAAERLRAGIIGLLDHAPQIDLAEAALEAHARSGLRVAYAPVLPDPAGPKRRDAASCAARFAAIAGAAGGRVTVQLGLADPQRRSAEAMALWRQLRDRHGLRAQAHLAATREDMEGGQARWPGGTVAELARQGLLDPGLSVAHAIWTEEADRALLARHGVRVVHTPAADMMLGSGRLPFAAFRRHGIAPALGSDAATAGGRHDLFAIMRLALMWHRKPGADPASWPDAPGVLQMASAEGAAVLGQGSGVIAPGAPADFILLRRQSIAGLLLREKVEGLLLQASPDLVEAVVIDGRWVMRDGRILAFDEASVLAEAAAAQLEIRTTPPRRLRLEAGGA